MNRGYIISKISHLLLLLFLITQFQQLSTKKKKAYDCCVQTVKALESSRWDSLEN